MAVICHGRADVWNEVMQHDCLPARKPGAMLAPALSGSLVPGNWMKRHDSVKIFEYIVCLVHSCSMNGAVYFYALILNLLIHTKDRNKYLKETYNVASIVCKVCI